MAESFNKFFYQLHILRVKRKHSKKWLTTATVADFLTLMQREVAFSETLHSRAALTEVCELLGEELCRRADGKTDLVKLAHTCLDHAIVFSSDAKKVSLKQLNPDFLWLVSSSSHAEFPVGTDVVSSVSTTGKIRLLGLPKPCLQTFSVPAPSQTLLNSVDIPHAPELIPQPELSQQSQEVFGIFLIVVSIVEAFLTAIRTQLFVDTTNRIDLSLGSEVINHLLRLPLSYFEKRPVGELATRVGELENIRSFLTGTALTVVMDAVFSVVYILVMAIYSPVLTIVALATVPLFAFLNLLVSPVMRRQLQEKAECNAHTHSYLVEVMAGMQTVKAQNLELRSRYSWQERYARYISAGFKTVSTQTTASSVSNFLNKFSSLLVLWVGANLVLHQQLTLGQLIAFRILCGYVTSPLLRLAQLWQNFQETALSLQRLSDILDTPKEAESDARIVDN